jgi:hypothetical protein
VEDQFVEFRVIETTTPINPGDSGGPVVNDRGELVGIAASHRTDARLVSHTIHVSELQSLLSGENKTVDSSIAAALDSASFSYTVNENGLFEVTLPNENGSSQIVFVESTTRVILNFAVRHIFSPAVVSNQPFPDVVASILLKDNSSVNVGAWEIRETDGRFFAVFAAKIGTTASKGDLKTVIRSVAVKSRDLVQAIHQVPAEKRAGVRPVGGSANGGSQLPTGEAAAQAPPSSGTVPAPQAESELTPPQPEPSTEPQPVGRIAGRWMAIAQDREYGEVGVGLRLTADGCIHVVIARTDCVLKNQHGRYEFDGRKLIWRLGSTTREAKVRFTNDGFVLENRDLNLEFVPLKHSHGSPSNISGTPCHSTIAVSFCR